LRLILQKLIDSLKKELFRKSAISLTLKILGMALGYIVMLYITNNYGDKEWGTFSLCVTVLSIAVVIPKFGFDVSLVRIISELNFLSDKKSIYQVLFKAIVIATTLSLITIAVIFFLKDLISINILNKGLSSSTLSIVSCAILPMVLLVIFCAVFQALKRIMSFIFFQTVLLNFIFLLLLIFNKQNDFASDIFSLYLFAIVLNLILSAILFFISFYYKHYKKQNNSKSVSYREIFKVSTPMLLSGSFALFMGWSDILMLSFFKSTTEVGIYSASLKLASIAGVTLIAINSIATPKFVEFYASKDFTGLSNTVRSSTKMIFFTTTPILIILIVFSKSILGLLGESFKVAYITLVILCVSRFINAISGSVGYIMQMTDQQKTYQNIIFTAFLINLILNYFLIPIYSYTGAAIASGIAMVFWNIALVIIIKKRLGFWTIYIPFLNR
jgi:O-antigen/teichoic acid export membrane protein